VRRVLLLVVVSMLLAGCVSSRMPVTKSVYDKLRVGMTQSQVQAVVGNVKPSGHATVNEVPVTADTWENPDGSWFNVKYRDGKLVDKMQSGLK